MRGIKKVIRDNKNLNWILIVSNWFFQSIINADRTEKIYKISFTVIFWLIFYLILSNLLSYSTIIIVCFSFFLAHSLNWIINGNFYNLIIHRLLLDQISKKDLFNYLVDLEKKLKDQNWILYAASFGSICNGNLKDSSDVDISIVRKPGIKNAISSIIFSIKEKKYADFKKIPLELYISDTPENSIKRFGGEKNPVVVYDPEKIINTYYDEKLSIDEARKLNNVVCTSLI